MRSDSRVARGERRVSRKDGIFHTCCKGVRPALGRERVRRNGEKVAEGRIGNTNAYIFSADEAADVGVDEATPVTDDYKERDNKFTGTIHKVTVELK